MARGLVSLAGGHAGQHFPLSYHSGEDFGWEHPLALKGGYSITTQFQGPDQLQKGRLADAGEV